LRSNKVVRLGEEYAFVAPRWGVADWQIGYTKKDIPGFCTLKFVSNKGEENWSLTQMNHGMLLDFVGFQIPEETKVLGEK